MGIPFVARMRYHHNNGGIRANINAGEKQQTNIYEIVIIGTSFFVIFIKDFFSVGNNPEK